VADTAPRGGHDNRFTVKRLSWSRWLEPVGDESRNGIDTTLGESRCLRGYARSDTLDTRHRRPVRLTRPRALARGALAGGRAARPCSLSPCCAALRALACASRSALLGSGLTLALANDPFSLANNFTNGLPSAGLFPSDLASDTLASSALSLSATSCSTGLLLCSHGKAPCWRDSYNRIARFAHNKLFYIQCDRNHIRRARTNRRSSVSPRDRASRVARREIPPLPTVRAARAAARPSVRR